MSAADELQWLDIDSCTATTCDGRVFAFDGNTIGRPRRFGRLLRERAEAQSVAWVTVELGT